MWPLPYLLAVAFLVAPTLLALLFAAALLEGRLLADPERDTAAEPHDEPDEPPSRPGT